jgi:hypothetical protein
MTQSQQKHGRKQATPDIMRTAQTCATHPVPLRRLGELADAAQFGEPDVVSETTSRYHGTLYCAVLRR